MNKGVPISPGDIPTTAAQDIPGFVFDAFNECIAQNWSEGRAKVFLYVVVKKIEASPEFHAPFNYDWLNVENAYRAKGFRVEYDKPAYCESYDAYFVFSKRN